MVIPTQVVDTNLFDIDIQVLQRYNGEARLQRLIWILTGCGGSNITTARTGSEERITSLVPSSSSSSSLLLIKTAYESAVHQCMISNNTARYKDIFHHYQTSYIPSTTTTSSSRDEGTGNIEHVPDSSDDVLQYDGRWYQDVIAQNRTNYDVLQARLQAAQAHLNKEAIRTCYLSIAEFAYNIGDMNEAFHCVLRAKDFCSTRVQTTNVTLQILLYALLTRNYTAVREYIPRFEYTLSSSTTTTTAATAASSSADATNSRYGTTSSSGINTVILQNCVRVASGLEQLDSGNYKAAAEKFRAVALSGHNTNKVPSTSSIQQQSPEMTSPGSTSASDVINTVGMGDPIIWDTAMLAPEDIALYAAFLSLAIEDNRSTVLNLAEDVEALELVPTMKDVIIQFVRFSKYKLAFALLEQHILPILRYDLYMSNHLDTLLQHIRTKAIVQYWAPYQTVQLTTMASELGTGIIQSRTTVAQSAPSSFSTLLSVSSVPQLNSTGTSSENINTMESSMLVNTLIHLMLSNRSILGYDTRIDLSTNALVRESPSDEMQRYHSTITKLHTSTNRTLSDTYTMLVRVACSQHGLSVANPKKKDDTRGSRRGGAGGGVDWNDYYGAHNFNNQPEQNYDAGFVDDGQFMDESYYEDNNNINNEVMYHNEADETHASVEFDVIDENAFNNVVVVERNDDDDGNENVNVIDNDNSEDPVEDINMPQVQGTDQNPEDVY